MHTLSKLWIALLIVIGLSAPAVTFAAIIPFGGRVTTMIPCAGGIFFTVLNLGGIGSGSFIWAPGSITYPWGPPRLGINILGTADVPTVCFVGKIPLFGLRVFMQGTSLMPGGEVPVSGL